MNIFEVLLNHPLIPLFIVANLAIGAWAHRKATADSFEDYALASRNLPTGVLVMTLVGTFLAAGHFAAAGGVAIYGVFQFFLVFLFVFLCFLIGTFLTPYLVYFENMKTMGDLMGSFYGNIAQLFTGLAGTILSVVMISGQLKAIGKLSSHFWHLEDPSTAIVCFGTLAVLYSALGGMRAVSYTDVCQIVISTTMIIWVLQASMEKVGGLGTLFSSKLSKKHSTFFAHPDFLKNVCISVVRLATLPTTLLSPPIVQRMLVSDKKQVRKMWYIASFLLLFLLSILQVITLSGIGMGVRVDVKDRESIATLFLNTIDVLFSSRWAQDFVFVGILAVALSTIDSFLHSLGISFFQDFVNPVRQWFGMGHIEEKQKTRGAKIAILGMGGLALLISYFSESSLEVIWMGRRALLASPMVLYPLIFGIVGIKTDKISWFSFCGMYMLSGGILHSLGMYSSKYFNYCFLLTSFLGSLAYFATHIYINKGIATLTRSKLTVAERLWIPSWEGTIKWLRSWLTAPLRLPAIADRKIVTTPTQSLAFSLVMIFLYMVGSITVVDASNEALYRMAAIRGIGITLCVGLMLEGIWSKGLKPYFPMYWFFTLWYCLPFSGSLAFLQSHQSILSIALWVISFLVLATLVDSMSFLVLAIFGGAMAFGVWRIVYGALPTDLWKEGSLVFLVTGLAFTIVLLLFVRRREEYNEKRLEWNRIAAGILAHDLRGTVQMLDGSGNMLQNAFKEGEEMNNKEGKEGYHLSKGRSLFLKNLSQHMVDKAYFARRDIAGFLDFMQSQILGKFEQAEMSMEQAAKEATHKISTQISKRVKITCPQDFTAKTLTGVFPSVISNLLKNASTHGNAQAIEIIIDSKKRTLTIHDDGKGIPSDVLPRIFDLHYSTTKGKESSGTGLAFVRMVMEASGGKVSCYSKNGTKGSFTDFVLDFSRR